MRRPSLRTPGTVAKMGAALREPGGQPADVEFSNTTNLPESRETRGGGAPTPWTGATPRGIGGCRQDFEPPRRQGARMELGDGLLGVLAAWRLNPLGCGSAARGNPLHKFAKLRPGSSRPRAKTWHFVPKSFGEISSSPTPARPRDSSWHFVPKSFGELRASGSEEMLHSFPKPFDELRTFGSLARDERASFSMNALHNLENPGQGVSKGIDGAMPSSWRRTVQPAAGENVAFCPENPSTSSGPFGFAKRCIPSRNCRDLTISSPKTMRIRSESSETPAGGRPASRLPIASARRIRSRHASPLWLPFPSSPAASAGGLPHGRCGLGLPDLLLCLRARAAELRSALRRSSRTSPPRRFVW